MDTTTFQTPSGYSITIKNDLTYGQYEDIQDAIGQSFKIDPETGKPTSVDLKVVKDANRKALEFLLVKIEKDGVEFKGSIRELGSKDGKAIMDKIDAILKAVATEESIEESKKKAMT